MGWPQRGPQWGGTKWESLNGKRTRTTWRTAPTYNYTVPFNVLRLNPAFLEFQTLVGFINELTGGTGLFLFLDPNDSVVVNQGFGAGDGSSTTFQLVRSLGGFVEPVYFPVTPTTQVAVAGTPTSAYAVSTYGSIIFDSPPANAAALTWTGSFRWGCRFDEDVFMFDNFMSQLMRSKAFKFSTEKLP